jgi:hypothetical protein
LFFVVNPFAIVKDPLAICSLKFIVVIIRQIKPDLRKFSFSHYIHYLGSTGIIFIIYYEYSKLSVFAQIIGKISEKQILTHEIVFYDSNKKYGTLVEDHFNKKENTKTFRITLM